MIGYITQYEAAQILKLSETDINILINNNIVKKYYPACEYDWYYISESDVFRLWNKMLKIRPADCSNNDVIFTADDYINLCK